MINKLLHLLVCYKNLQAYKATTDLQSQSFSSFFLFGWFFVLLTCPVANKNLIHYLFVYTHKDYSTFESLFIRYSKPEQVQMLLH